MLLLLLLLLLLIQLENPFWQILNSNSVIFRFLFRSSISIMRLNLIVSMQFVVYLFTKWDNIHGKRTTNAKKIKIAYCVSYIHIFLKHLLPNFFACICVCVSAFVASVFNSFLCILFTINDGVDGDYSNKQYNRK